MATQPNLEIKGDKKPTQGGIRKATMATEALGKLSNRFSWSAFDKPFYRWLLLFLISLAIGAFLAPGFASEESTYDSSWVGQISSSDIRSPGDYNIADHSATEAKRADAQRSVLPIYDHRAILGVRTGKRVNQAFSRMQTTIADFIIEHILASESVEQKLPPPSIDSEKTEQDPQKSMELRRAEVEKNIEKYFADVAADKDLSAKLKDIVAAARTDFNRDLQAIIPEDDFMQLYRYHFSAELGNALARMVDDIMTRKIINERELMEKGRNEAITIRMFDSESGPPSEYELRDTSMILDFKEVNQSLWRHTNILSDLGKRQRKLLLKLAGKLVQPNLTFNRSLTLTRRNKAADQVKTMLIPVKKGEMIIRDGERFGKRHLTILQGIQRERLSTNPFLVMFGYSIFYFVFILSLINFGYRNVRKVHPDFRDLVMMSGLLLLFVVMVKSVGVIANALTAVFPNIQPEAYYIAIPIAVGAALIRIVTNSETAVFFSVFISVLFGMLASQSFIMGAYCMITCLVAADAVGQCRTRTTLFFAGLRVSLVGMLLVLFLSVISGDVMSMRAVHSIIAAGASGFATGIILTGLTPIIEFIFRYTTDIKLLELANLNHPLLKRLIVQSPGTYHHSIIVGSLVEAAAESIHANPLLARVAAYYHDVGKIKTPNYFGENQQEGQNPHDTLSPNMSVLILQSHVKEGVELARKYKLGDVITDIIAQHHGTSLIRYFHHKAVELKTKDSSVSDNEQDFRYPGPKPQTREAGLVMLADSVEAAARSLSDASPERIKGLVQKIINGIFRDEQLNECELTLKDLHQIARAFTRILVGIYHNRPQYPGSTQRSQEKSQDGRSGSQSTKKAEDKQQELEEDDEQDIKRLGGS